MNSFAYVLEEKQSRETPNAKAPGRLLVRRGIEMSHVDLALQLRCQLLPHGSQFAAVDTPWGIELHEPVT